jgi:hypothetical protein
MNAVVFYGLLLLAVLAPLPLGSNREWSWSLCALIAGALTLVWSLARWPRPQHVATLPHGSITLAFLLVLGWVVVQALLWTPGSWHHPLWAMAGMALAEGVSGRITLSPEGTWTALMRLLAYALVFVLAFQIGRDRDRAHALFRWLAVAGVAYAVFALSVYWSGNDPAWLFGDRVLARDVRGPFINRNHFATWQGLALLCALAYLFRTAARPEVKPYALPRDRETRVVEFILRAWLPLTGVLLVVTALVLTHSRGGFTATLAGVIVLLWLIDRRASYRNALSRVTVIAALAVASIAFYLTSEVLLDRIERTDITTEERLAVFSDVNRGIADNPLLGYGYGSFADSFRLYDRNQKPVRYDRAHNTWLENAFELGLPAALALFLALGGLALICLQGVRRRHRDWVYPATGVAAAVLVALHATVDFSLQIPAVAILFAVIMGVACAQSRSAAR